MDMCYLGMYFIHSVYIAVNFVNKMHQAMYMYRCDYIWLIIATSKVTGQQNGA